MQVPALDLSPIWGIPTHVRLADGALELVTSEWLLRMPVTLDSLDVEGTIGLPALFAGLHFPQRLVCDEQIFVPPHGVFDRPPSLDLPPYAEFLADLSRRPRRRNRPPISAPALSRLLGVVQEESGTCTLEISDRNTHIVARPPKGFDAWSAVMVPADAKRRHRKTPATTKSAARLRR